MRRSHRRPAPPRSIASRVRAGTWAVGAALLAATAARGGPAREGPAERPNVVVYLVDTVRRDHLGLYGYERDTAPNLAALARDGVVFENAYAPSSWTRPSVASLLSGLNPLHHGVVARHARVPRELRLVSEILDELGYDTAAFVTNPHVLEYWGFGQGFDAFIDVGAEKGHWKTRSDAVVEAVRRHLEKRGSEPFFYYVHTIDPHSPYNPPPPHHRRFARRPAKALLPAQLVESTPEPERRNMEDMYDAEIFFSDTSFGELMAALREQGVYDDTLIVFVSDHGEEFLDHGSSGHGHTLYQELVRVPMVVKFPRGAHAGTRIDAPASLIDIVPSVLGALGRDLAPELDGVDLADLAAGEEKNAGRALFFDLSLFSTRRKHEPDDGRSGRGRVYRFTKGVVLDGYKYLETSRPEPQAMLFDLARDPGETNDLAESDGTRAAALARVLGTYRPDDASGLHLALVNGRERRVVRGRLTTEGRFTGVRRADLEEDDRVTLDPTGTSVTFEIVLANPETEIRDLRDVDGFTLALEPPGAAVVLEELGLDDSRDDGGDIPLFFVRRSDPETKLPLEIDPADPDLAWHPDLGAAHRSSPGAYLSFVNAAERVEAESIPEELKERLEALGYAE